MDDDYTIEWGVIRDESPLNRDGSVRYVKACQFWIGKHGPFWERFDRDAFTQAALVERVEALRTTLRTLPR